MGIETVMVEGGSRILTSFLRAQWVDYMLVTIAPSLIGGTSALHSLSEGGENTQCFPGLKDVRYNRLGEDLILEGVPEFRE
jgi:riboflavin biosynthesis pyrimidine reductase